MGLHLLGLAVVTEASLEDLAGVRGFSPSVALLSPSLSNCSPAQGHELFPGFELRQTSCYALSFTGFCVNVSFLWDECPRAQLFPEAVLFSIFYIPTSNV